MRRTLHSWGFAFCSTLALALPAVAQPQPPVWKQVEEVRGRSFERQVPVREIERDELRRYQELTFHEEYSDVSATEKTWRVLGLLEEGVDLRELELVSKTHSLLGFYVFRQVGPFDEGSICIVPENVHSMSEVTAHEHSHALSDQAFDLSAHLAALPRTPTGEPHLDRRRGLFCLEEGVATLVGETVERGGDLSKVWTPTGMTHWSKLPYFRAKAWFSYYQGCRFAHALWQMGGWDLVDRAYADPPVSSEQILHPERYLGSRDEPTRVCVPNMSKVLDGFRPLQSNCLGEFTVSWLYGEAVASGWDGDCYVTLEQSETGRVIVAWYTTWDSVRDAAEFADAVPTSERGPAAQEPGELDVERRGRDVIVIAGASEEELPALRELLRKTRLRRRIGEQRAAPGKVAQRGLVGVLRDR